MPKERVDIRRCDGVIGVADARDLPVGAAHYAENLDLVTHDGTFVGLQRDEAYSGSGYADCDQVALFEAGATGVVYDQSAGALRVLEFTHTSGAEAVTQRTSETVTRSTYDAMISDGIAVHVGLGAASARYPRWVGNVYHTQFSTGTQAAATVIADATLTSDCLGWKRQSQPTVYFPDEFTKTAVGTWDETAFQKASFDNSQVVMHLDSRYTYYASAIYDGYQQAPLKKVMIVELTQGGCYFTQPANDLGTVPLLLGFDYNDGGLSGTATWSFAAWKTAVGAVGTPSTKAHQPAVGIKRLVWYLRVRSATGASDAIVNRRVTGIKLYRSRSVLLEDGTYEEGDPLLIKYIPLNNVDGWTWSTATESGGGSEPFGEDGTYKYVQIDDNFDGTRTFERDAGYPATLESMQVHWAVSCYSGQYHFVGRCWHSELQDVDTWLFRSKPFKPNTFDWTEDYLVLPARPNALISYAGRIFAFCSGRTFVINPHSFEVEEEWEGMGAAHSRSVAVSERGMFWGDNSNIYLYDSARVHVIGTPVLRVSRPRDHPKHRYDVGWLSKKAGTPTAVYSPIYDSFIIFYDLTYTASDEARGLMYHVPTSRWMCLTDLVDSTGAHRVVMSAHTTPDGDVVLGCEDGLFYKLFGKPVDSSNNKRRPWRFLSRQMGAVGEVHKYYHIYVATHLLDRDAAVAGILSPPSLFVYVNSPAYTDQVAVDVNTFVQEQTRMWRASVVEEGAAWPACRDFAVEVRDPNGLHNLHQLSLIRRRITPR